jgi:hypothetical protein
LLTVAEQLSEIQLTRIGAIGQPTCGVDGVLDPGAVRQPDQTWVTDCAEHMDHDV